MRSGAPGRDRGANKHVHLRGPPHGGRPGSHDLDLPAHERPGIPGRRIPLAANTLFYLVAFLSSAAMMTLWSLVRPGAPGLAARLAGLPPALLLAGTMSSVMVLGTIILLPRLGARRLFLLQVAGQVIMALVVSHLGILGTPRDPLTLRKGLGAFLLLAGAVVSVL
ncbi:MAG: DMT family transporter [Candidatus Moduliflexus flocculans]|nr:DMT family transporter [Candidatus Moduliflexus flocculans]